MGSTVNAYNRSKTISKSSSENSVQAIKQRVQGSWIVESLAAEAKDGLVDQKSPLVLNISGDTLSIPEFANHSWDMQWQGLSESNRNDQRSMKLISWSIQTETESRHPESSVMTGNFYASAFAQVILILW